MNVLNFQGYIKDRSNLTLILFFAPASLSFCSSFFYTRAVRDPLKERHVAAKTILLSLRNDQKKKQERKRARKETQNTSSFFLFLLFVFSFETNFLSSFHFCFARAPEPLPLPLPLEPEAPSAYDVGGEEAAAVAAAELAVTEKTLSPPLPFPSFFFFVGVSRGDHEDQKGAAVEVPPVGELSPLPAPPPPPLLAAKERGGRLGAEGVAALEDEKEEGELETADEEPGAWGRDATAVAAFLTQDLRKNRIAAAAASTPRPTPIQAPIESEGLLLAEAVFYF